MSMINVGSTSTSGGMAPPRHICNTSPVSGPAWRRWTPLPAPRCPVSVWRGRGSSLGSRVPAPAPRPRRPHGGPPRVYFPRGRGTSHASFEGRFFFKVKPIASHLHPRTVNLTPIGRGCRAAGVASNSAGLTRGRSLSRTTRHAPPPTEKKSVTLTRALPCETLGSGLFML